MNIRSYCFNLFYKDGFKSINEINQLSYSIQNIIGLIESRMASLNKMIISNLEEIKLSLPIDAVTVYKRIYDIEFNMGFPINRRPDRFDSLIDLINKHLINDDIENENLFEELVVLLQILNQEARKLSIKKSELNSIAELLEVIIDSISNPTQLFESDGLYKFKPHKDVIFEWYQNIKLTNPKPSVPEAFEMLCEKITFFELDISEYINTDTPENFDRTFYNWQKRSKERN